MRPNRPRSALATLLVASLVVLAPFATRAATTPATSVHDSPGYVPLRDPDSLDEANGRRMDAPRVKMSFHGGARSLDELGRVVCGALHAGRSDSLLALCVRSDEFRVILWPEFPQSRPATGLRWDDAWPIVWGHLNGGSIAAVREHGGHVWTVLRVEESRVIEYRNFRLHEGVRITARNDVGDTASFDWIRSVAERRGRFKIAAMRD